MSDVRAAAAMHVQQMTIRVKDQENLLDRLTSEGADVSQEIERLLLLRRALEEMTLQLSRLLPTSPGARQSEEDVRLTLAWWQRERQARANRKRR